MKFKVILILLLGILLSCDNASSVQQEVEREFNSDTRGIGFFDYEEYLPFQDKSIRVYYYIPESVTSSTEIMFVFHGNGRNAIDYRNAMIQKADEYNFIVIAPKFSSEDFPGGDMYNLGNVFEDGDNPSQETLNTEANWTFSVIEPLFDYVLSSLDNFSTTYHVFGHSAGGQFAHRYLFFKPNTRVNKMVVSAPGWYTTIDYDTKFPYGFNASPLEQLNLELVFLKKVSIICGEDDNNPNASSLRRNPIVDLQGTDRLARAQNFYNTSLSVANENNFVFNWNFETLPNVGHEYLKTSQKAADIIFNQN